MHLKGILALIGLVALGALYYSAFRSTSDSPASPLDLEATPARRGRAKNGRQRQT
jgi:hypothetical protein